MTPCLPIDTHGRPIILIGLMGCGKTTVGKELSKATGLPLLDMDAVIEEQIGKSISAIFKEDGEARFRALETALLRYLKRTVGTARGAAIISTGGGVVMRPENRAIIRELGFAVWFRVSVSTLLARTSRSSNRPLLKTDDRLATLTRLDGLRAPLYAETAHLQLETTEMDIPSIVRAVHQAAKSFFSCGEKQGEQNIKKGEGSCEPSPLDISAEAD